MSLERLLFVSSRAAAFLRSRSAVRKDKAVQAVGILDAVCTASQTVLFRSGILPRVGRQTNLYGYGGCHMSNGAHSMPLVVAESQFFLGVHKAGHLFGRRCVRISNVTPNSAPSEGQMTADKNGPATDDIRLVTAVLQLLLVLTPPVARRLSLRLSCCLC
jgi:hypothetical protein